MWEYKRLLGRNKHKINMLEFKYTDSPPLGTVAFSQLYI